MTCSTSACPIPPCPFAITVLSVGAAAAAAAPFPGPFARPCAAFAVLRDYDAVWSVGCPSAAPVACPLFP